MNLPDPRRSTVFRFTRRDWHPERGEVVLGYAFDNGPELLERIVFPDAPWPLAPEYAEAFGRALELLHLLAGVSYYKAGLPAGIDTADIPLDGQMATFIENTWTQGLAEFAHRNGLSLAGKIHFTPRLATLAPAGAVELPECALVAMGGGKDSLVCLELLREAGVELRPFTVGASKLIRETVRVAGLPLLEISRQLAPELMEMNRAGAWNGHVPVTAINSAIGLCAALLYGCRWVVFANERSAEEATLFDTSGQPVNHQYSKSLAFEQALRAVVAQQVAPGLEYFSLTRPMGELAVTRRFATMKQYHPVFSSCNRNFHRDGPRISGRWCGDCPKCRFTTLALAPFLPPAQVSAIIGRNLLDDPGQEAGFRALCGLGADKPFECVGTMEESRAALAALGCDPAWRGFTLVSLLASEIPGPPTVEDLLTTDGPHCIPDELDRRVVF